MPGQQPTVTVIGEALLDLAGGGDDDPWLARPGGSPYNVALALARLERTTSFAGRLSRDPLGTILREHAERSGVDLSSAVASGAPTTIAVVRLTDGDADYRFGVEGTADFQWTDAELAAVGETSAIVHFGSLASWTEPGDAAVLRRVGELGGQALISYDPNVRPHLQPDRDAARRKVEAAVAQADLVKTSAEDLRWVAPAIDPHETARSWLSLGPRLVVVTAGADGATAYTARGEVSRRPRPVDVVDTIGAGDAFTAGLLDGLLERQAAAPPALDALSPDDLGDLLDGAGLVAALTCSRAGANPPRRAERDTARDQS